MYHYSNSPRLKTVICSLILMLGIIGMIGCQKTPDEEAVVQKSDQSLGTIQELPTASFALNVPDKWTDSVETGYASVHIEADVRTATQDNYPIYQVSRGSFSADTANQAAALVVPDEIVSRRSGSLTREDVEMMLAYANRGVPDKQSDGSVEYVPFDGQQEYIAELERTLESGDLPSTTYDAATAVHITNLPIYDYYVLADESVLSVEADEQQISILTKAFSVVQTQSMLTDDGGYLGEGPVKLYPEISSDEAASIASEYLGSINATGMQMASAVPARLFDMYSYEIYSQGWMLVYNHTCDYLALDFRPFGSDSSGLIRVSNEGIFAAPWNQERIMMYVDKNGIQTFSWNNPLNVDNAVKENVNLMDFADICENAKNLVQYGISWLKDGHETFYLYDMVLTTALTVEKDNPDNALMLPVWVFSYRNEYGYQTQSGSPGGFALSAIDGSRVNLFSQSE